MDSDRQAVERRADGRVEFVLELPSDLRTIEAAVTYLVSRCRACAYGGQRLNLNFRVGLTEALANAMLYGNDGDPAKSVRVEVSLDAERVVLRVIDQGHGFDPGAVPDPTLPDNLQRPGGRGLFLIRRADGRGGVQRARQRGSPGPAPRAAPPAAAPPASDARPPCSPPLRAGAAAARGPASCSTTSAARTARRVAVGAATGEGWVLAAGTAPAPAPRPRAGASPALSGGLRLRREGDGRRGAARSASSPPSSSGCCATTRRPASSAASWPSATRRSPSSTPSARSWAPSSRWRRRRAPSSPRWPATLRVERAALWVLRRRAGRLELMAAVGGAGAGRPHRGRRPRTPSPPRSSASGGP